ncbi:hypothetical protein HOLleu_39677 [Holothuria leucospilota]|uniref:Uncharacterized protein n=1 Tax=Holothuria leucospilota TaxID=206669 RepID=A0A9Q0YK35_HOLLE|nr:hypothetical protein HOLleu_39677 [Holothuria leucospilota]
MHLHCGNVFLTLLNFAGMPMIMLKISFLGGCKDSELSSTRLLEKSLSQVKTWMEHNRLKMNDSKTEFIQFGSENILPLMLTSKLYMV